MSYSAKNIIVGAGVLYIGKTAGVEYDETTIAAGTVTNGLASTENADTFTDPAKVNSSNWRHVGYTSEGAEMSFEPDYGEVQVDQLLDVAKIFKQGQRVMLNTTFTEATLENFLVTIGGKDGDKISNSANGAQETVFLNGGALGYSPVERSVLVVGPGPDSKTALNGVAEGKKVERLYVGYRALSMETVTVGIRRNEATVFPVSFRLLPSSDSAKNAPDGNQTYGKVIDRVYGNNTPA